MPKLALLLLLQLPLLYGSAGGTPVELLSEVFTAGDIFGGRQRTGPIMIKDSIIGDIVEVTMRLNCTVAVGTAMSLVNVVVASLNDYGHYGIEMSDVRAALARYVSRRQRLGHG